MRRRPRIAFWIKWNLAWCGPLWYWGIRRTDRWHAIVASEWREVERLAEMEVE